MYGTRVQQATGVARIVKPDMYLLQRPASKHGWVMFALLPAGCHVVRSPGQSGRGCHKLYDSLRRLHLPLT
jgi:hypothetical protein